MTREGSAAPFLRGFKIAFARSSTSVALEDQLVPFVDEGGAKAQTGGRQRFGHDDVAQGSLAMEQEKPVRVGRRLAAIVAADVAGYSRLMGLDEVGTAWTHANTAR